MQFIIYNIQYIIFIYIESRLCGKKFHEVFIRKKKIQLWQCSGICKSSLAGFPAGSLCC